MKNKSDIKLDHSRNEVVVLNQKGQEVFRKPKTEQYISIAHAIYMFHKYGDLRGRGLGPGLFYTPLSSQFLFDFWNKNK